MSADDLVETETPVFTECEVYMIATYVAVTLGIDDEEATLAATEEAIPLVLNYEWPE